MEQARRWSVRGACLERVQTMSRVSAVSECQNGEVWGDLGDPREPARGPRGPKAQTKRSDDGLIWDPMPKVAKTVILSTVLKGSPRGPREAKS